MKEERDRTATKYMERQKEDQRRNKLETSPFTPDLKKDSISPMKYESNIWRKVTLHP